MASGGIAAFLSQKVVESQCIAFPELGSQAVYQLTVHDFPLLVGIDANGGIFWKRNN